MSKKRAFQTIRGMRDVLPQDMPLWKFVIDTCENAACAYGYSRIETPLLEESGLFVRSVGEDTDIVKKEMFTFQDHGGDSVTMRPEFTASIMRAYIEHGMMNQPKPVKLFETGACFRYERPQSGRFRQFHQFTAEIIGSQEAAADAESIGLSYAVLKELGLEVVIQVNSIGTFESRRAYVKQLKSFYQPKMRYLCKDCLARIKSNPLRMLDCKKKKCVEMMLEAPQIIDHLDEESKNHFVKVLEYLDAFDLPYALNPQIVRGLDYYSKTVFEIWAKDDEGAARTGALGGGGRYDGLADILGGCETPACGFALGLERVIAKLKEKNVQTQEEQKFDIFLAHLGEEACKRAFLIVEGLRAKKYRITYNLCKASLKHQLELANKFGVRITLILGEKEVSDHSILIKEMDIGAQESVPLPKLERELEKRLRA
ncbi:MAG: Histidine-tRNA ligase [Parcubacteria group bacterium GW2011_GWC2_44_17]|uniref:Histidine--tRNA ligase n=1 Tax=Candidatus Jacksonbacteria bacterium RIFCSPLOWO2_02_FULL_44_20 TaxID=1798460 RepID=A0A1G2A8L7_9BACT|nr:MAG: Histidine-tRNA ligase [Parcubacteria group bacterium GW2011_GWC2_44_17]KKT49283.1 MAG: Histidine-tRNA ligase [Parcubacteria group bacterium GW2011_GWF2_44_17]OGY70218.1 MAG: histidine--tRNA ligase [Candidatus Jacksonbacteria bacterium RIFCSPHIGHO2_12_FULL_44_12]OGY70232.1 MAG: histidine--tRNA ligase [Candidatus Jacksonbacteria bacterium RIFCSPHIGHO2_02_FULL_44_25]OGY72836.1 MAG: histidine--tRNA ligase [Candidatus Jacksonbacteria bacterium RIFCSPLOWO2_02_FULL_44_20]OGY74324.1 MAG: histi